MTFYDKVKWILGILLVFVLIVTTNLIDRNNFVRVKDSVVTIYEDRLIANDLIFEISKLIQEKEIAAVVSDTHFYAQKNQAVNTNIQGFIARYQETKLTKEERIVFENLKSDVEILFKIESEFIATGFEDKSKLINHIFEIKEDLYNLTKIQLEEGKRQMSISQKAIETVELFTQIEIYLLVFLAVIIQIIVMYNPKKKSKA